MDAKKIVILILLLANTAFSHSRGQWIRLVEPSKIKCHTPRWITRLGVMVNESVGVSEVSYNDISIFASTDIKDVFEFQRSCNRAKLAGIDEKKPVFLNISTGQMNPEDGFFVHTGE